MIGSLDSTKREVTIIGAGISGLLSAYELDKQGYRVTLLERKERSGGLIQTMRTRYGMAESAAHSLLASKGVVNLCRELGVEFLEVRKESRARFILRDGRLSRFPLHVGEAVSALGRAAFARSENGLGQLSLDEWARRHLGDAALQYLFTPFVRGIYGAQPSEIGVAAAFPTLAVPHGQTLLGAMLRKTFKRPSSEAGGEKEKARRMVAPRYGMGDLVGRLEKHLETRLGDRFRRGVELKGLVDSPNLLIATPSYVASKLLEAEAQALSASLREIAYTPIVSVTAFVSRDDFTRPVSGIGVLVPACEGRKCLGILFNSSSFEGRVADESRYASFTILLGGSSQPEWISATDEEIGTAVREELSALLGIQGEPLEMIISRWPQAIPQYSTALPRVWQQARESWCARPGRLLFGNYTGQVSLRGMIESAASMC